MEVCWKRDVMILLANSTGSANLEKHAILLQPSKVTGSFYCFDAWSHNDGIVVAFISSTPPKPNDLQSLFLCPFCQE